MAVRDMYEAKIEFVEKYRRKRMVFASMRAVCEFWEHEQLLIFSCEHRAGWPEQYV